MSGTDTCPRSVTDCPECKPFARPHTVAECGDLCGGFMASLLATEEGHEAIHNARRCPNCGRSKYTPDGKPDDVKTLCKHGGNVTWSCKGCGTDFGGHGSVADPCNSSWWTRLLMRAWAWRDRRSTS